MTGTRLLKAQVSYRPWYSQVQSHNVVYNQLYVYAIIQSDLVMAIIIANINVADLDYGYF